MGSFKATDNLILLYTYGEVEKNSLGHPAYRLQGR